MNPLNIRKYLFEFNSYLYLKQIVFNADIPAIGPLKTIIFPTNKCNNDCVVCYSSRNGDELSYESIVKVVRNLKNLGSKEIILSGGGEPFCHKDINKIIKYIKIKGFHLTINTCLAINEQHLDSIVSNNVDELFVSFWAANSDEYKQTHNKRDFFDLVVSNLIKVKKLMPKIRINMVNVILKQNCNSIIEMEQLAKKLNVDLIQFRLPDVSSLDKEFISKFQINEEESRIVRKSVNQVQFKSNKKLFLNQLDSLLIKEKQNEKRCHIGWFYTKIDAKGDVFPCCGSNRSLGNVNENAFMDIWHSPKYLQFRKGTRKNLKQFFGDHTCQTYCSHSDYNRIINRFIKY